MQLTIIKKNKLSVFNLPEKIVGNHWITDFENGRKVNLINIEATEEGWNIVSNNDAFIEDNNGIMIPNLILKEYCFYILNNQYKNERYYLYTSPVNDKTFRELGIEEKVSIGSDEKCDVSYKLGGFPKQSFNIVKRDNNIYLEIFDNSSNVYINQKRVITNKIVHYGDIVFSYGLKLILMRREKQDILLVNNPANLLNFNSNFVNIVPAESDFKDDNAELSLDIIQKNDNYFYRTPHFYKTLDKFSLSIDAPPQRKDDDKTPAALTIGPMLTMSMTSVITLISTLNQVNNGTRDMASSMTSLIMCVVMLASSLLWPLLTKLYQKISTKMYEKKRQRLYKNYIKKKEEEIEAKREEQRSSLLENNFSVADCQNVILNHDLKLWQRRITDEDFLNLPVGIGNIPMQVEIKYPEEHFSLYEDNLLDIARNLGKKERILNDVPISFDFYNNKVTGVVGDQITTKAFVDRLILQLMANYSYDELKIVNFTQIDNENDWNYLKVLPHSWSDDHSVRYFGSSNDDYREIIYGLEKILHERQGQDKQNIKYLPHYVIITDSIKSIDSFDFIKNIMTSKENYGFSIIMLVDKVTALPNECKSFISVNPNECSIYSSVINLGTQSFKIDYTPIDEIYNCAKNLANIPIDIKTGVESSLPDTYQFLEMYQVGKVEQLNALDRWKKSNPILSLQAPIGIGKSGEVINLDLHEKYHGPHGLVAGTTGSGKSEFIISYILSLAVNYHPYEVQVILIDYKGGSLAGAFSNGMYQLPHLAGTITNLDGNELNRSLASIESEVKRRQKEFNTAREIANESSIDIYKYQKLWREGRLKDMPPIAHLFIISDEFAELKEQQPEFMEKLISVARVGRSLGVHLILATQKPGGVVDQQIWSNTKFRVCLKVQDTSDSQEVLKKPDAAFLKKTGRFYLQVGYDEVYTLGQSAWAGAQYYPRNIFKKDVDTSVNMINNIGFITKSKDAEITEQVESMGEELPNVVKYLCEIAKSENVKIKKLWLDKIPEKIYVDNLIHKYEFTAKPYYIEPIVGEYDNPAAQNQYALKVDFSNNGNALVYGITGSGKEDFITSLIYSCMVAYKPEEVNFYIIDFGAETLRVLKDSPYVGDIVFISEQDKLINLIKMLNAELELRKEKFANWGGNYQTFIQKANEKLPNYIVIINNYEAFIETYEDLSEEISQITREAFKYGIYFLITASNENSIRSKMRQNFALTYVLQQNSEGDYMNILGNVRGKLPAKNKGRGLFKNNGIFEFQTAFVKEGDDEFDYLKEYCEKRRTETTYRAKRIPVLPQVVDYEAIKNDITVSSNIVIGINKDKLVTEKYNFKKNAINLICSQELENTDDFVNSLINEIAYIKDYDLFFINSTEYNFQNENLNNRIITNNFDDFILKFVKYIDDAYNLYSNNNFNNDVLNPLKKYMIFIYGVYDFINKLSSDTKQKLSALMKQDNQLGLISFVFVDNPDVIKGFAFEDWFKNGCDTSRGVFVGSGVTDQSLFKIAKFDREDREEIPKEFGYLIQTSKIYRIKLLTDFNPNAK